MGTITRLFSSCIDLYHHTLHLQLHTNDHCTVKTNNNIFRCNFPVLERVQWMNMQQWFSANWKTTIKNRLLITSWFIFPYLCLVGQEYLGLLYAFWEPDIIKRLNIFIKYFFSEFLGKLRFLSTDKMQFLPKSKEMLYWKEN